MTGETNEHQSGWTVDTLHAHMRAQMQDMRALLQERFETQTEASATAFAAQQTAMAAALAAAKEAVSAALLAAQREVEKGNVASEKRFDSVNEFRKTLSDQAAEFVTRAVLEVLHGALVQRFDVETQRSHDRLGEIEVRLAGAVTRDDLAAAVAAHAQRIDANADAIKALELRLSSRLDLSSGRDVGARTRATDTRASIGTTVAIVSVTLALLSAIFAFLSTR